MRTWNFIVTDSMWSDNTGFRLNAVSLCSAKHAWCIHLMWSKKAVISNDCAPFKTVLTHYVILVISVHIALPLMYMGPPQQTHYDQIFFHSRITCQLIPIKLKYGLSWYALAASMKFAHIMISEHHCQVQTQIMDKLYVKLIGENLCNGFDDTLMPIGYKHYPFPSLIVVHNLVMNQVHDLSFSLTPNPNATGYTCLLASIDTATRKYICTSPCSETHQPPNWPYKI